MRYHNVSFLLQVVQTDADSKLHVSYCFQHHRHDPVKDVIAQRLPLSFREELADLMSKGVPPGHALIDLRTKAFQRYQQGCKLS